MTQTAKAQEPSMEEILASIRRIIADDDASKSTKPAEPPKSPPAAAAPAPPPAAAVPPPAPAVQPAAPQPAAVNDQNDIDSMLAELDVEPHPPPPMPEPPQPAAAPAPDVLDLTEAMAAPAPGPSFRTIDAASDVVFTEGAAEPQPPQPPEPLPEPPPRSPFAVQRPLAPPERPLISPATVAAVDSAFNSLAHTLIGQNARTLEDLVKEMLRPMLKSWLDDNLPGIVDRIVRTEIERVSRGR
jgi:uncharacterized protein